MELNRFGTFYKPQLYTGDPRTPIPSSVLIASSIWEPLGFCRPHTQKINAKQMRSRSSRALRRFARVYFHVQSRYMQATYAPDEPWQFWLGDKPEDSVIHPHSRINMAQVWDIRCIYVVQTIDNKQGRSQTFQNERAARGLIGTENDGSS